MARKLRLEYPGAIQHVINRGNYREDIFLDDKTKAAFETCLFEACEKSRWLLHAFIVMRNHYHLGLETPDGNLIWGMQWLQSTFGNRFNRFRQEHGHLFQGRYKSILTEKGKSLGQICDYIHLNPVKAGIVPVERLAEYRYSSYWYLLHPTKRPKFLRPQTALECAGGIADDPKGWAEYEARLKRKSEGWARKRRWKKQERKLCHGWAVGSDEFRAALVKEFNLAGVLRSWETLGVKELRLIRWEAALQSALRALGRRVEEAEDEKKSAPWKLAIAAWMKSKTQVSNGWLGSRLNMGTPTALSHNLSGYRRLQSTDPAWKKLIALNEA